MSTIDDRLVALTQAIKAKFAALTTSINARPAFVNLQQFGAVGGGTVDDYAAIAAALASGARNVVATAADYRSSQGITVPDGMEFVSLCTPVAGSAGPGGTASFGGTRLMFDNGVMLCVDCGLNANGTPNFRGFSVTRSGTPPAGSIGVRVNGVQMCNLRETYSYNHAICGYFKASGAAGISLWISRFYTAAATDAHWVIDGYPEVRASFFRMGNNGAIDTNCNAYVRIQGGGTGGGSGPNTFAANNYQMNLGNGAVAGAVLQIQNITKTGGIVSEINMSAGYHESFNTVISTDATVKILRRLSIKGTFNKSGNTNPSFFALDAATVLKETDIDVKFYGNDLTLNNAMYDVTLKGFFQCSVSITAPSGTNSTVKLDTHHYGNLTVAGSGWQSLTILSSLDAGFTFTNDATPTSAVTAIVPGQSLSLWTPVLSFGGATTGITYTAQSGAYQVVGNKVSCEFRIILSSKGSATGIAEVTLPVTINPGAFDASGGGMLTATNAMAGLTGPVMTQAAVPGPQMKFLLQNTTATIGLTDANFTNTSEIDGHLEYFL